MSLPGWLGVGWTRAYVPKPRDASCYERDNMVLIRHPDLGEIVIGDHLWPGKGRVNVSVCGSGDVWDTAVSQCDPGEAVMGQVSADSGVPGQRMGSCQDN